MEYQRSEKIKTHFRIWKSLKSEKKKKNSYNLCLKQISLLIFQNFGKVETWERLKKKIKGWKFKILKIWNRKKMKIWKKKKVWKSWKLKDWNFEYFENWKNL